MFPLVKWRENIQSVLKTAQGLQKTQTDLKLPDSWNLTQKTKQETWDLYPLIDRKCDNLETFQPVVQVSRNYLNCPVYLKNTTWCEHLPSIIFFNLRRASRNGKLIQHLNVCYGKKDQRTINARGPDRITLKILYVVLYSTIRAAKLENLFQPCKLRKSRIYFHRGNIPWFSIFY